MLRADLGHQELIPLPTRNARVGRRRRRTPVLGSSPRSAIDYRGSASPTSRNHRSTADTLHAHGDLSTSTSGSASLVGGRRLVLDVGDLLGYGHRAHSER